MELFAAVSVSHHLVTVLRQRKHGTFKDVAFLPYPFEAEVPTGTLEINVAHKVGLQLTTVPGAAAVSLMPQVVGETTTGCCFHALNTRAPWIKDVKQVTSCHFDVDNFVAVWTVLYPSVAQAHQRLVLEIARVGDFRELRLDEPWQHEALKVICWLHSEERRHFQKSYESKSTATSENNGLGTRKFEYFLPRFAGVLARPDVFKEQWVGEYERVVKEYEAVNAMPSTTYPNLGCVVVKLSEPAHYYALFSTSKGYDVVFSMYRGNRYEVSALSNPLSHPFLTHISPPPHPYLIVYLIRLLARWNSSTRPSCRWGAPCCHASTWPHSPHTSITSNKLSGPNGNQQRSPSPSQTSTTGIATVSRTVGRFCGSRAKRKISKKRSGTSIRTSAPSTLPSSKPPRCNHW